MDGATRRKLRVQGQSLRPLVEIGRRGLEPSVLDELDSALKREHLVKVRLQNAAAAEGRDAEDALAQKLASAVGAEVVERRGHTLLIYRESTHSRPPPGR